MTDIQAQLSIQIIPDEYELLQRFRQRSSGQPRTGVISILN